MKQRFFKTIQVVDNRLYTGSTDGTLRVWTLKGLRSSASKQPSANGQTAAAAAAAEQRNTAEQ